MNSIRFNNILIVLASIPLLTLFLADIAHCDYRITPTLTISEIYDSNIYSTPVKVQDYITRVGTNIDAQYKGSNINIKMLYIIQINILAQNSAEDTVTQDGNLYINLDRWFRNFFKEANVAVTEDFTFTPELKDYYFDEKKGQVGPLSSYGVRTKRTNAYRNAFSIKFIFPFSERLSLDTKYSNIFTEYSDPALNDNITHVLSTGTSYKFTTDTLYSNIEITDNRADSISSNIYSAIAGVRHSFTPVTLVDTNAGVERLDDDNNSDGVSTLKSEIRFSTRSKSYTYNAGYSKKLNPLSGISAIPTVAKLFYINVRGAHSVNSTTSVGANYAINESIEDRTVDTHSYNLTAGLSHTIRKWLQWKLSASHFKQVSKTEAAKDIQRDQIMLQFLTTWN